MIDKEIVKSVRFKPRRQQGRQTVVAARMANKYCCHSTPAVYACPAMVKGRKTLNEYQIGSHTVIPDWVAYGQPVFLPEHSWPASVFVANVY